jgi:hypothetical protein
MMPGSRDWACDLGHSELSRGGAIQGPMSCPVDELRDGAVGAKGLPLEARDPLPSPKKYNRYLAEPDAEVRLRIGRLQFYLQTRDIRGSLFPDSDRADRRMRTVGLGCGAAIGARPCGARLCPRRHR